MKKLQYLFWVLILIYPNIVLALKYPTLHYNNAIVYDMTDERILYELNPNERSYIASLTKILTVITAMEMVSNFNEQVVYTKEMQSLVRWDTSKAGLKAGDVITYNDLFYACILPSGADAAIALAVSIAGSQENFVNKMNEKAMLIGMTNSHFANVVGLDDDNNYSTLEDLLKLLKYAIKNDAYKQIYTTKEYELSNGLKISSTLNLYNRSGTMDVSRILGSKTGFTSKANLCISAYFVSNNHEMLLITLNAPKNNEVYNISDTLSLINFIDNNYSEHIIFTTNDTIKTLSSKIGIIEPYNVNPSTDVKIYLPNDYDSSLIDAKYVGKDSISFFDIFNSQLGTINYYYDDVLFYSEPVKVKNIKVNYLKASIYLLIIIILLRILFRNYSHYKKATFKVS